MAKRKTEYTEPWERQIGETSDAYGAFEVYRDMGSRRSLPRVARETNKSLHSVTNFSSRYGWTERARLYDNDQTRTRQEQEEREIREMNERLKKIGMLLQKKGTDALQMLEAEELDGHVIVKLIEAGAKIERAARSETRAAAVIQVEQTTDFLAGLLESIDRAAERKSRSKENDPPPAAEAE